MFNFISTLAGLVTQPIKNYQMRKQLKVEQQFELQKLAQQEKVAKANALIEMAKTGQQIDYDLDKIAMQNMNKSWKDEFILLVFLAPVIMAFIPQTAPYSLEGFKVMALMPSWYIGIVIGMVVVIYGMRGLLKSYLTKGVKTSLKSNQHAGKQDGHS